MTISRCDDPEHGPDCAVLHCDEVIQVHLPSTELGALLARQQAIDDDFHRREAERWKHVPPKEPRPAFVFY